MATIVKLPNKDIYVKPVRSDSLEFPIILYKNQVNARITLNHIEFPKEYSGKKCRLKIELIK